MTLLGYETLLRQHWIDTRPKVILNWVFWDHCGWVVSKTETWLNCHYTESETKLRLYLSTLRLLWLSRDKQWIVTKLKQSVKRLIFSLVLRFYFADLHINLRTVNDVEFGHFFACQSQVWQRWLKLRLLTIYDNSSWKTTSIWRCSQIKHHGLEKSLRSGEPRWSYQRSGLDLQSLSSKFSCHLHATCLRNSILFLLARNALNLLTLLSSAKTGIRFKLTEQWYWNIVLNWGWSQPNSHVVTVTELNAAVAKKAGTWCRCPCRISTKTLSWPFWSCFIPAAPISQ